MRVTANDLGLCGVEQLIYAGTIQYDTEGAVALYTMPHDAVITRTVAVVTEAFNAGTTNVLTVGTTAANANELLGSDDVTEGTAGAYSKDRFIEAAAKSKIYAKFAQTGTAATAGSADIYLFAVGIPEVNG